MDDEQMRVGVIGHPKIRIGGGSGQFNFLCTQQPGGTSSRYAIVGRIGQILPKIRVIRRVTRTATAQRTCSQGSPPRPLANSETLTPNA